MSMIIGTITLDKDMEWTDRFSVPMVTSVADRTLAGTLVAQEFPLLGGKPVTLEGTDFHGWQKRSTVESLMALAESLTDFTINLNGVSLHVRFRNEDYPAVEFTPITTVEDPDANFWYYGTLKFITVG